jgi:hypothetical protein
MLKGLTDEVLLEVLVDVYRNISDPLFSKQGCMYVTDSVYKLYRFDSGVKIMRNAINDNILAELYLMSDGECILYMRDSNGYDHTYPCEKIIPYLRKHRIKSIISSFK